jgi:hypothetical protein
LYFDPTASPILNGGIGWSIPPDADDRFPLGLTQDYLAALLSYRR